MLHVATMLWDANRHSQPFSRDYNEIWVEKLYRAFNRNLTVPFRFVVFTDRRRDFSEPVSQEFLSSKELGYGCCIEPFRLDKPSIIVGLDTIVVGNIDHLAQYCLSAGKLALPRDPYQLQRSINGVALVPAGHRKIFDEWSGENDMEWLRKWPNDWIDDLFPGEVLSLKAHRIRDVGLGKAKIVYFHGRPKPNELLHIEWVRENWS